MEIPSCFPFKKELSIMTEKGAVLCFHSLIWKIMASFSHQSDVHLWSLEMIAMTTVYGILFFSPLLNQDFCASIREETTTIISFYQ
jgi:hypothetical protein